MTALDRLFNAAVVPVVVLDDAADAVPTARALLAGRQVRCLNGAEDGAAAFSGSDAWEILLIDDFQYFQEEADLQALCERIRSSGDKRLCCSPGEHPRAA